MTQDFYLLKSVYRNDLQNFRKLYALEERSKERIEIILKEVIFHSRALFIPLILKPNTFFPISSIMKLLDKVKDLETFTFLLSYMMPVMVEDKHMLIFEFLLHLTYKNPPYFFYLVKSCKPLSVKYMNFKPRSIFSVNICFCLSEVSSIVGNYSDNYFGNYSDNYFGNYSDSYFGNSFGNSSRERYR